MSRNSLKHVYPKGQHMLLTVTVAIGLALILLSIKPTKVEANHTVSITVIITEVNDIGHLDEDFLGNPTSGQLYAGVWIDGVMHDSFADRADCDLGFGVGCVGPPFVVNWEFTQLVPINKDTVTVSIEIWDDDPGGRPFSRTEDDQGDADPKPNDRSVDLILNLRDRQWSGDTTFPDNCARGDVQEGDTVSVCWAIIVGAGASDPDRDGFYDAWELNGLDQNDDGIIDVDLPGMGAHPLRKDIFVEVDCIVSDGNNNGFSQTDPLDHSHCPMEAAIKDVVLSFANAPVTNLDNTIGIQLHVDTGQLFGTSIVTVVGTDGAIGTYGDFGGGGNLIPEAGNQIIDWDGSTGNPATSFYALKQLNFPCITPGNNGILNTTPSNDDVIATATILSGPDLKCDSNAIGDDIQAGARALIFRYAFFAHQTNARQQANDCTSGWSEGTGNDFFVSLGGTTSQNGGPCWVVDVNGFSVGNQKQQAGTFMHEFGHTLGLGHGGKDDKVNNKPNYLSLMNYAWTFCDVPSETTSGLPRKCDYSREALPTLDETSLDECAGPDSGRFGLPRRNWNGSLVFGFIPVFEGTTCPSPNNSNIQAEINGDDVCVGPGPNGVLDTTTLILDDVIAGNTIIDGPRVAPNHGGNFTCDTPRNPNSDDTPGLPVDLPRNVGDVQPRFLEGNDDWEKLFYFFQTLPTFNDGVADPVDLTHDPESIEKARRILEPPPDLSISKDESSDPAVAGDQLTYTLTILNNGTISADEIIVVDTLPAEVNYISDNAGCSAVNNTITCDLGVLLPGESRDITIATRIDEDLVAKAGGPTSIGNTATVNNPANPDLELSNNTASEVTQVVAQADLEIVRFEPVSPPKEVLIGQPVQITLRKVIKNNGPSAPMDAELELTADAPTNSTVAPETAQTSALALQLNEQRAIYETSTIECGAPGPQTFTFTNQIQPLHAADSDSNLNNNTASVELNVECIIPVVINIKPGSSQNPINLRSLVPLAVLTTLPGEYGTPLGFDATRIDPLNVRFGPRNLIWSETGGASEKHQRGHPEDAFELDETTRDGDTDMILHFSAAESGIKVGVTEACVKGEWVDLAGNRFTFFGCDLIRVVR